MRQQHNKLVRDRIPDIIKESGDHCTFEILSSENYLCMLDAKLDEELAEYHKDQNIEELADLIEVIYAAAKARGYSREDIEAVRVKKAIERGSFDKKIFLKETFSPDEAVKPKFNRRKYRECPKCAGTRVRSIPVKCFFEMQYKVRCSTCGFETDPFESREEAGHVWNDTLIPKQTTAARNPSSHKVEAPKIEIKECRV